MLFTLVLVFMFRNWWKDMKLGADDRRWLALAHRYAIHDERGLPEPGRFNAGQKMLFWVQGVSTVLLLTSGLVLFWPASTPGSLRLLAVVVHPAAAVISISGIIVHVYMGLAAVPGALHGMLRGWVPAAWASTHHPVGIARSRNADARSHFSGGNLLVSNFFLVCDRDSWGEGSIMVPKPVGALAFSVVAVALSSSGCKAVEEGPPTYALVTMRHDETRIQMVTIMTTFSEAQCNAAIREYMAGFESDPSSGEWRQTERSCRQQIESLYERVMRKEKFHATYIAFSPKNSWEYEARIVLYGIPSTQAQEICQQVAREVGNRYQVDAECNQGTIG
jgi:Prokaryotic cytochrome b561